jgi:zinc/manganese transport system permease protein
VNPPVSANPLTDLHELLQYPFMVHALEAGSLVAVMASVAGWFMVLRRETFAGHTLSVMSFPGASGAALAGAPLAAGYFLSCGIASLAIAAGSFSGGERDRRQESAVVASVQVAGFALGFVFLSLYAGVLESLETLLFGSFLGITQAQVETIFFVALTTIAFFVVAGRPLLTASIDEPLARARGVPVGALRVAFLLVLGLSVAATAQITGALLVFALLVAPAAAAQQLTMRVGPGLLLTIALALVVVWVGLGLAYFTNYSSGFYVTTVAFVLYLAAVIIGRWRS